jgi:hypothetical protein
MKIERNGFVFLRTFNESIEDLDPQDKCIMLEAIINYGLYGDEPDLTKGYLKGIWKLISSTIDVTSKKYDTSVENGKKGGRPKKPNNNLTETQEKPNNNLTETQEKPNNNPTETLKENKIKENKIELNKIKIKEKENKIEEELNFGKYNYLL